MIYLDVTSATFSPLNMGVQRMIRGLFSLLNSRGKVMPLRWDFRRKCYARLSSREQDFLTQPFAAYECAVGTPGRWDIQHFLAGWRDARMRGDRVIDNRELLRGDTTLLIPDLCWDARIHSWSRLAELPGRTIAIFHDAMPLRIPGQADSHDALFSRYVRALALLDLVICISQEVEQDLHRYWRQFGLAPKPTCVLPWPVPFPEDRPDNPPNQTRRHIIYVARLKLRKNHLVLLEACESLWKAGEQFTLDLIGIEDAYSDTRKILHRVRALAAQGRPVRWRKHISDSELAVAYRECSFTAFPSRLEGFGLPIIESLWHRRPVICGHNGAIGEVAEGGGCLQIDQNSVSALADAMRRLLNDSSLYHRLYEEASERSFRRWENYADDLEPILAQTEPAQR